MTDEKPTGDAGASITERLESFLAPVENETGHEAAPEKEVEAPAVEAPENDAPDEAEGPQYELSDVAKVLGIDESMLDVDEDGSLKIKTKIDGKEGAAKFQDFIKSYQLQGHIDAKARQVADYEKAASERMQAVEQYARTEVQNLHTMAQAAQQLLTAESAKVDWNWLAANDQQGYIEKRHAFESKQAEIGQLMQAANQKRAAIEQQVQHKQAASLLSEFARLASLVPEWADQKTYDTERVEMARWLQSKGASPQAIAGLRDAGVVAVLRAQMIAERDAPKVAAAEKRVRAAPKLVRPGQGTTAKERAGESVRELRDNIRKSGGERGIQDYLIATGKV